MHTLVYVVPLHNDATIVRATIARLSEKLAKYTEFSSRVLFVENGSQDSTAAVARAACTEFHDLNTKVLSLTQAGIGHAYAAGLEAGVAWLANDSIHLERAWLVLTASDLPFGFTDLDAFCKWLPASGVGVAIGSKAHANSSRRSGALRAAATLAYRLARRTLVGMRTGDSQGSFFLRADVASEFAPQVVARDYFYTTELVYLLERKQRMPMELPVQLEPEVRISTVKPLRDGTRMLKALIKLRARNA
jgi:dolichyl-phosphate beta-glucosyltransferase